MDHLFRVIVDGVRIVEPAVISVPLLAVHDRVGGVVGLRQLVSGLHFSQLEVTAFFLTRLFFFTRAKRSTLNALSEK